MSSSFTTSWAETFTVVHARHMAAKVAADLKRMQRLYGSPSDLRIDQFEAEIVELLKAGYLGTITYGFRRDGNWVPPTLRYSAADLASGSSDDDPGRVPAGADVSGASFYSFLTNSAAWHAVSAAEQQRFESTLPFQRGEAAAPTVANGYFADDKTYAAGGRSLSRASVRTY